MKIRAKHRKLFYVPGMISLLLLPVLGIWFIKSNQFLRRDQSVEFTISDSISDKASIDTHFYQSKNYVPKREYKTYLFDGNNDEQKLKDLALLLKEMVGKNDTIIGFRFSFGNHAKYQTFISAQDLLFINKVHGYTMYKNDIYAFEMPRNISKTRSIQIIKCGGVIDSDINEYWAEQKRKAAREFLINSIKQFWQIPIALLVIMALNLYVLIKFNKNKKYNQKSYI